MRVTGVRTGQVFNKHLQVRYIELSKVNQKYNLQKTQVNPKFSIVVKKYKYTSVESAIILSFYCRFLVRCTFAIALQLPTQKCCSFFFYCTHMHNIAFLAYLFLSVFPIYIWCVFKNFPHQLKTCLKKSANFYCWCTFWLYRYVTRTNVSFFDSSPNDQITEHSCA